jgi:hypothetical protein
MTVVVEAEVAAADSPTKITANPLASRASRAGSSCLSLTGPNRAREEAL